MKTAIAALLVTFFSAPLLANTSTTVMSCSNLEIYEAGTFKPANFSVTVRATNENPQSYKAVIVTNGRSREERDVEMRTSSAADARELKEMTETLLPGVKWEQVNNVRAADIMTKANRDDGRGLLLIELYDKKQAILGKILEIGWGFGRCK